MGRAHSGLRADGLWLKDDDRKKLFVGRQARREEDICGIAWMQFRRLHTHTQKKLGRSS